MGPEPQGGEPPESSTLDLDVESSGPVGVVSVSPLVTDGTKGMEHGADRGGVLTRQAI